MSWWIGMDRSSLSVAITEPGRFTGPFAQPSVSHCVHDENRELKFALARRQLNHLREMGFHIGQQVQLQKD